MTLSPTVKSHAPILVRELVVNDPSVRMRSATKLINRLNPTCNKMCHYLTTGYKKPSGFSQLKRRLSSIMS